MTKHEAVEILEEVKMIDDSMFAYSQAYNDALDMAIEALKAQEPVKPVIETRWETPSVYDEDVKVTENKCGACGIEIDKWDKFCRMCGRAVKWE